MTFNSGLQAAQFSGCDTEQVATVKYLGSIIDYVGRCLKAVYACIAAADIMSITLRDVMSSSFLQSVDLRNGGHTRFVIQC